MMNNVTNESKTEIIIGKLVYCKEDILGQGGFGFVFKGKLVLPEGDDEVDVAIKRLQTATLSKTFRERELKQKELNHQNVVKLYHVEENNDFM